MTIFILNSCSNKANKNNVNTINEHTNIYTEQSNRSDKELKYLKIRKDYVKYFNKISEDNQDWEKIYKQDSDSLIVLEKMLRDILKNSRIDSISKFGKINLETLTPELGSGMLDGLKLNNNSKITFVTSKALFFDYFKSEKINSINDLTSKQLSVIFSTLISDARVTVFYSEKLPSNKKQIIYGSVAAAAQDIGSFPPDNVFVLVASEDFIYIYQKYLDKPINVISKCQNVYDSIYNISQKHFNKYKDSNLEDKSTINSAHEIEGIAWDKYCECYQENFKNNKQYNAVKKRIEKLIENVK